VIKIYYKRGFSYKEISLDETSKKFALQRSKRLWQLRQSAF